MRNISKTIVYPDGEMLDLDKCKQALFLYWQLNKAEKRAFDRLQGRRDLQSQYEKHRTVK
jgi:hypothetical protein